MTEPVYRLVDDPALYTPWRWARPRYVRPSWVIVHDPANDDADLEDTLHYLRTNGAHDSYHQLVDFEEGVARVNVLAPAAPFYVGHAGILTRIPGTRVENGQVNVQTVGVSLLTYGQPIAPGFLYGAAEWVADLVVALRLPNAGNVLAHREISVTGRRVDPRGVDMEVFRKAVHDWLAVKGYAGP